MKKRNLVMTFTAAMCAGVLSSQATLQPGDIAIIGVSCDDPDQISFAALVPIVENEVIKFTDNGWLSTGALRTTEGTDTYTVPSGGLAAGDVVLVELSKPNLSTEGDQVLAYQGEAGDPTFIYAINLEGDAVWQASATNAQTSALPTGLVNGETAVALMEKDNAACDVDLSTGNKASWLAYIGDPANWTSSNNPNEITLPGTTSSGVDLRAFAAAGGTYVEFVAYDVETEGEVKLALLDDTGAVIWSGAAAVTEGPQSTARFLVPGLEAGATYDFEARDEVGKWWTAHGVTVGDFSAAMTSMSQTGVTIAFDSVPGHAYEIQWTADLSDEWETVKTVTAESNTIAEEVAFPDPENPAGFFRARMK